MSATPAPLHDVVGPVLLPTFPVPLVLGVAVGVLVLGLTGLWFFRHRRVERMVPPRERALRELERLRGSEVGAYEVGVRASDILREYVRDQYGLDGMKRTSLEFLEALRGHAAFDENERASLAAFLEASDLLKYARASAGSEEIGQLVGSAERLVRGRGAG